MTVRMDVERADSRILNWGDKMVGQMADYWADMMVVPRVGSRVG